MQNQLIKLSHELADKLEARLTFIAADERFDSIFASPDVNKFLQQHEIDAVELMALDYADWLRGINFIKAISVNPKI